MPKVRQLKNNFTAGEVDPRLLIRNDIRSYDNGASLLRNVLVMPQGGFIRRPGLEYIDFTTTNQKARFVSFEFNTEQAYLIVFTPGQFKVYRDNGNFVELSATVTASPINTLTAQQIAEMQYIQSADTLILFHPDVQSIKITRTSHTVWVVSTVAYTNLPVFAFAGETKTNPATTLTPSGVTGTITLTAGGGTPFSAASVGQYVELNDGLVFITEYTSPTVVRGKTRIDLINSTAAASGAWTYITGYENVISNTRGWPSTGTFYGGRLWVGGLKQRPQTVLGSNVGDFFNFDLGLQRDDEGIDITIDDDQVNAIRHIFPGQNLQIFTTGGEYFFPQELGDPLTPKNTYFKPASNYGSSRNRPVTVDGATLFLDKNGKVLRQFLYSNDARTYEAPNISLLSSHLIVSPVSMSIRRSTSDEDAAYNFIVNSDGTVAVQNTLREQEINAFSLFQTAGNFEDVAVVGDDVYFEVSRILDGTPVRCIERMNKLHFLDCSVRKTSPSETANWSGFDHMDGQLSKIRADDYIVPMETPDSGDITLGTPAREVELGLSFVFRCVSLPADFQIQTGTTTHEVRRLVKATVEVSQSREMQIQGQSPGILNFDDAHFDAPVSDILKTGYYIVYLGGYDRRGQIEITQEEPLEATVLGMTLEVKF